MANRRAVRRSFFHCSCFVFLYGLRETRFRPFENYDHLVSCHRVFFARVLRLISCKLMNKNGCRGFWGHAFPENFLRAQGVKISFRRLKNMKNSKLFIKNIVKMAGGEMHPPHPLLDICMQLQKKKKKTTKTRCRRCRSERRNSAEFGRSASL